MTGWAFLGCGVLTLVQVGGMSRVVWGVREPASRGTVVSTGQVGATSCWSGRSGPRPFAGSERLAWKSNSTKINLYRFQCLAESEYELSLSFKEGRERCHTGYGRHEECDPDGAEAKEIVELDTKLLELGLQGV